ncbi:MAG: hypothetical protein WD771_08455 [Gemmatimonadaceae bacterium]
MRTLAATILLVAATRGSEAQVSSAALPADSVQTALRALSLTPEGVEVNGRYVRGDAIVEAGDTVRGPLVTLNGDADIRGVVAGNVYAIFGDVTVRDGAEVLGGVSAWRGRVLVEGGRVRGAMHARPIAAAARPTAAPISTARAIQLSAGWTAMLIIVGLVVLVLASRNLEATAQVLERDFGRAFLAGVVGQIGFLPLLLLGVVALAVTLVGILLIPFVLVVAPVALAGLVTLGFLSLALLCGRALRRGVADPTSRAAMLGALVPGIVLLMAPWLLASAVYGTGTVAVLARAAALGITWVAATAGLGGALLSRAGTGRAASAKGGGGPPPQGGQTPTPGAGGATARRPVPARPGAPSA